MTEGERARGIKTKAEGMLNPAVFFPELSAGFQQSGKARSITSSYMQKVDWKKN